MGERYDVLIIGGGVIGAAVARELSRYKLAVALLEKEADVAMGASCRNSGVLHAGFNYKPGTVRAEMDVKGNAMMPALCKELKVKMKYIGKMTVALDEEDIPTLHALKEQGDTNGVPGLELIGPEKMNQIQPNVGGIMALYSPSSGIVNPYGLTIALAENACANGVHIFLNAPVTSIEPDAEGFTVSTTLNGDTNTFQTRVCINAAGVHADKVAAMAGIGGYRIYPCRGEYYVLDKRLDGTLKSLVYQAPKKNSPGLGIHLTPTVEGNILIGPSNEYLDAAEDYGCTADVMRTLQKEGKELLPDLQMSDFIQNFSGIRAKQTSPKEGGFADFILEDRPDVKGFINLMGLESPGLTSAPAIAAHVASLVAKHLPLNADPEFKAERPVRGEFFFELSPEEKRQLVLENPNYGEIVCRCEQITKQEILDALSNPLGARTITSVKYRARATMGRCQGGFCLPKIVQIMKEELGYRPDEFFLRGRTSPLFVGTMR